ncbi:hypothetical protein TNCV_235141 [Trichonephila clavipes]|uniref:Uncharacterized protein n=1 Tax=Trichonephila clavipes TaxID=2585209 RepID=A0A8X6VNY0_TRICX|nr:hypothetical protein TNCV_235141 [Trichonephila clavipes]
MQIVSSTIKTMAAAVVEASSQSPDDGNRDLYKNVDASRFNALYGRQGCILTRTVESNQDDRFDDNESGVVSFKSTGTTFLVVFPLFYIFPEVPTHLEREPLARVNPASHQYIGRKTEDKSEN